MRTGTKISAIGHGTLIALALFGVPWLSAPERDPVRVTEVSFISEADFDRAQAAAPAEAPRAPDAPATPPLSRPAEPEPQPEISELPPEAPEPDVATLEPPAAPEMPDPGRITPRIVTVEPPTAAAPPRSRPAPRIEPNPAPPPPEPVRQAETPRPVTAPEPDVEVARVEETPEAPPEATPEPVVEEAAPAPLALVTSGRPRARQVTETPRQNPAADAVMAAVQRERTRRPEATAPTPPTPATTPAPAAPNATSAATSLPVGPPITSGERDGLRLAVQRCWNVPAGLRDAQQLKVTLAAELAADGTVISGSIRLIEPSPAPDGRFQQAYEAGRRALIRCGPYTDLPRDKYAQWQNIEIVFNPEGMVSW